MKHPFSPLVLLLALFHAGHAHSKCRNVPGSAEFPTAAAWRVLNTTISGRLVLAVPSAKYCASLPGGACTDAQWTSALFRGTIPGAMNQDYDVAPPSLCLRNSTTCGQGDVPIYAVKADTVEDVQVCFIRHDYLGRSTAPNSLLIHMANLTDVVFTDAFVVGGENLGSAVTVGPGVPLRDIYQQTKAQGKIAVGGSAATVERGHSAISPLLGLAADNALEFEIVVASGALLKVNSVSNPDLFFALRGGGAGSWGVIVSATLRTHPTFNVTNSIIQLAASSNAAAAALAGVHTKHIFDLDAVRGGQYYYLESAGNTSVFGLSTFTNTSLEQGTAVLTPFLDDALAVPGVSLISKTFQEILINDALFKTDDVVGANLVMGSRLVPTAAYQAPNAPATVEKVYRELLDSGLQGGWCGFLALCLISGLIRCTGQVSDNVNTSSAVNPAWRTAKTHVILPYAWDDSASLAEINTLRHEFQTSHLAILEQLSGPNAGSYSNEADMFEPDWETTFYGPNYAKLSAIKQKYDPHDLFIVTSGVGSERWDALGICTVDE
ncbi:FAD-binding domain-containing protein [Mycena olivaceomarginata]|nr:FAD-binding domain-containing protein [Mycena olivaceomarginata]